MWYSPKYWDNGQSAAKPVREGSTTIPIGSTLQAFDSGSGEGLLRKRLRYSLCLYESTRCT